MDSSSSSSSPSKKRKRAPEAASVDGTHGQQNTDKAIRRKSTIPTAPSQSGRRRKQSSKVTETPLGFNYRPKPQDVICARGQNARNHPGNQSFRFLIESNLQRYRLAQTKKGKSNIVSSIVESIRSGSPPGKFVRKQGGQWYETGDDFAREKTGQGFRDSLYTEYRSSSKAKISRRRESDKLEQEFEDFMDKDSSQNVLIGIGTPQEGGDRKPAAAAAAASSSSSFMSYSMGMLPPTKRRRSLRGSAMLSDSLDSVPGVQMGSSGSFQYPSSVIGSTVGKESGAREMLPVPSSSAMIAAPVAGYSTSSLGFTSSRALPAEATFNTFYGDLLLSRGQPERNVQISDPNQQQHRLVGRDWCSGAPGMGSGGDKAGPPTSKTTPSLDLQTQLAGSVRKFPPMPPSVFEGGFGEVRGISDRPGTHQQQLHQQQHPIGRPSRQPAGRASRGSSDSSRIQDDEPLPFNG